MCCSSIFDHRTHTVLLMGIRLKRERQTSQFLCKMNPHLAGCMPRQKTGLTLISSWRALASSSLCTSPKLLGQPPCVNLWESTRTQVSMNYEHNKDSQLHMITRSESFIPGVTCPGLVMFSPWEKRLGGGLDPVVNLQRRIYTCKRMTPKWT